jgi:hypothetical protein
MLRSGWQSLRHTFFKGNSAMENKKTMKVNKFDLISYIILAIACMAVAISYWIKGKSYFLIWIFFWGSIINIIFLFMELQKPKIGPKSILKVRLTLLAIYVGVAVIIIFI